MKKYRISRWVAMVLLSALVGCNMGGSVGAPSAAPPTASQPPTVEELAAPALAALKDLRILTQAADKALAVQDQMSKEYGIFYEDYTVQAKAANAAGRAFELALDAAIESEGDLEAAFTPVYAAKALWEKESAIDRVKRAALNASEKRWSASKEEMFGAYRKLEAGKDAFQDAVFELLARSPDGKAALLVVREFAKSCPSSEKLDGLVKEFEECQSKLENAIARKNRADLANNQEMKAIEKRRYLLEKRKNKLIEKPYSKSRESEFEVVRTEARELQKYDQAIRELRCEIGAAHGDLRDANEALRSAFRQLLFGSLQISK